jgi:APA family basic amino acid/polyamine antiporter
MTDQQYGTSRTEACARLARRHYLMADLPGTTWVRFFVWMGLGLLIYFAYGRSHLD